MAKPRVFISSTYFDLRVVRADLDRFIKEMGYEPVLFERGHIPWSKDSPLENDCYREIDTCDIVVSIIGSRYGSTAKDKHNSVTQTELKTAIEHGKQIYIFVEKSVLSEYGTYLNNKSLEGFKPASVDNIAVFAFIEEMYGLSAGNPIIAFEISDDITRYLKDQWAGLFQRLLKESSRQKEINLISTIKSTAETLNSMVTYLSEQSKSGDQVIKDILLTSHPAFAAIKKAGDIPYRVVFFNLSELKELFKARGYKFDPREEYYDWDNLKMESGIRINKSIFEDDGKLKIIKPEDWNEKWVSSYTLTPPDEDDDEIPF